MLLWPSRLTLLGQPTCMRPISSKVFALERRWGVCGVSAPAHGVRSKALVSHSQVWHARLLAAGSTRWPATRRPR